MSGYPERILVPRLDGDGFKVGLVWAGSATQKDNHHRSCPLDHYLTLADLPGMQFYSLQTPLAVGQSEPASRPRIVDLEAELTDYARTAALVEQLDLVISVCTSVAHLTGAMGKPVWILLAHYADWRWAREGEASAWYPSARLFRQRAPGDWAELLERVRSALAGTPLSHSTVT